MPGWNAKSFFFLVFTFIMYVIAVGDAPKWKAIFTTKKASQGMSPIPVENVAKAASSAPPSSEPPANNEGDVTLRDFETEPVMQNNLMEGFGEGIGLLKGLGGL